MSRKNETERQKQIQEKCQMLLTKMLRDDDNKYCVDCDAKGPRWASWNLGVFLCIRCAGIHRNLGVHISRVKSVNLDSWTPEQVVSLEQMGNSRARAVYEAMLPDGFRRPQTDSALENFIRAKYEHKKYLAREWVPPPPPKVDWDKEIDEELDRQKRKKKGSSGTTGSLSSALSLTSPASASTDKRSGGSSGGYSSSNVAATASSSAVPLPKLKAPASSTKSSSRTSSEGGHAASASQPSSTHSQPSGGSSDLLSLSLGPADGTADRTPKKVTNGQQATGASGGDGLDILHRGADEFSNLAKEEADFFNQASSSVGGLGVDNGKLTKDKIMALYSAAPSTVVPVVNQGYGGGGSAGFGAFGSFQQAGNTYPPQANAAATVSGAYNGQGGFGAFQAFPGAAPVAGGAVMNGQFMMSGQQAPPMMYNNLVANGGVPFQQPAVPQGMVPPQPFGAMQFPNALLQQQHQQHQQQPPLVGGVNFPTAMGGMPPSAGFANFPKQQQPTQSTVQSNDKLSNQFGNMNLRDVWQ